MTSIISTHSTPQTQCRAYISANGRLNIPSQFRKAAKLKDGDEVLLSLKDDIIQIQLLDQVIAEAQAVVAKYFGQENLTDDLARIRSEDAIHESQTIERK